MGVHGLWRLLEPTGEPVALETLENKVLAIDVSMWLHQVLKGYHDASGNALPNAHLLGLFHRICKLMFYGIKPVFVFDGGVPMLKQQTMINRKRQKKTAGKRAEEERMRLLRNLMEQDILQRMRGDTSGSALLKMPARKDNPSIFELPEDQPEALQLLEQEEAEEESSDSDIEEIINWDNFDPKAREFKMLPAIKRLEILCDLKETRKTGSWRRIHEMPQDSGDFSSFQMRRLLVRRSAQVEMEGAEKELSKTHTISMEEMKEIMAEKGSLSTKLAEMENDYGKRIASDTVTRIIMISNKEKIVSKLAIEEDKIFVPTPAVKVKEEPVDVNNEVEGAVENNGEVQEIEISDDETDRSMVEEIFVDSIREQVDDQNGLTQEEILAVIKDGQSRYSGQRLTSIVSQVAQVGFDEPSTSKAHPIFIEETDIETLAIYKKPELEEQIKEPEYTTEKTAGTSAPLKVAEKSQSKVSDREKTVLELLKMLSDRQSEGTTAEKEKICEDVEPVAVIEPNKDKGTSIEIKINPTEVTKEAVDIFSEIFPVVDEIMETVVPSPASVTSAVGVISSTEDSCEEFETVAETEETTKVVDDEVDKEMSSADEEQIEEEPQITPPRDFRSMSLTDQELKTIEEKLAKERTDIVTEIGRQERIATNLNDQICNEAQELISLFGLPFLVAPMEAEAQCAMLDLLRLTNGTVTDDSDIWLFGGRTVYRNFFNQSKNVERYTSESISKSFMLSRDRLILLAMLVGSDYTVGLAGVGPVTALEIIAEFSNNRQQEIEDPEVVVQPLKKFREWWVSKEITNLRRKKLKNILKDLKFNEGFPSEAVANAYVHPQVNDTSDKFKWEKPDIDGLIKFASSKFGWNKSHVESVLDPVVKRMGETQVQGRIDSYFTVQAKAKDLDLQVSSRVRNAINQLLGTPSQNEMEEDEPQPSTSQAAPKITSPLKNEKVTKPRNKKTVSTPSKLNEFKQQFTKKPKPLKLEETVLPQPKQAAKVPDKEKIPQREKDKEGALQSKLKAIEIFRKRKIDPAVKSKRPKRLVAKDDYLSQSSDSD